MVTLYQTPPHATIRSNLTTYLGIFDNIKKIFSKENQVDNSWFSPSGKGACSECKGIIKFDLAYLGDTFQICEKCEGKKI